MTKVLVNQKTQNSYKIQKRSSSRIAEQLVS
jgi:hypothetical protein